MGTEDLGSQWATWYGANVAARYAISDQIGIAVREEYYVDADGFTTQVGRRVSFVDSTVTVSYAPTKYLLLKLDNRADLASTSVFQKKLDGTTSAQITTTLGIVVTSTALYRVREQR